MKDRTTPCVEVPRSVIDQSIALIASLGPEHDHLCAQLQYHAGYVAEAALLRIPEENASS